ncbi:uncharacterized protein [Diadema antillarum]|uniref:uncharacterized protein n=1 Tax=Diadema antillarum TaxID=105358 RepID=UPI003A895B17
MSESEPIFGEKPGDGNSAAGDTSQGPMYHDSTQSPRARCLLYSFIGVIVINVLIALILCFYQGANTKRDGFLYFLMACVLILLVVAEILMIPMFKRGDFAKEKHWFLYFMGFCILLEAIFTDILVMN